MIRQVNINHDTHTLSETMMAERVNYVDDASYPRKRARMDQIEATTKCHSCGWKGNWFEDNRRAIRIMNSNNIGRGHKGGGEKEEPTGNTSFCHRGQ